MNQIYFLNAKAEILEGKNKMKIGTIRGFKKKKVTNN